MKTCRWRRVSAVVFRSSSSWLIRWIRWLFQRSQRTQLLPLQMHPWANRKKRRSKIRLELPWQRRHQHLGSLWSRSSHRAPQSQKALRASSIGLQLHWRPRTCREAAPSQTSKTVKAITDSSRHRTTAIWLALFRWILLHSMIIWRVFRKSEEANKTLIAI